MAGIGFEIRKILKKNTLLSLFEAYGYAGIISSGPWVLSILALMLVGILSAGISGNGEETVEFLVTVTYLMAGSLILTGGIQLMLIRYISDRLFEGRDEMVLPNLLGACLLVTLVGGIGGSLILPLFNDTSLLFKVLLLASFVVLCNIWLITIFLSGMKEYKLIVGTMFFAYTILVLSSLITNQWGLEGLFFSFLFGHFILMFAFLFTIIRKYPASVLVNFQHLMPSKVFYALFWAGTFYNLGIWADKFTFWFSDSTSQAVIGPLRASIIYDLPIFLAYLSIIPGMAVFLVRMETDFSERYDAFYDAIREGATLKEIEHQKDQMVLTIRRGIFEIYKVQGVTLALMFLWGKQLLDALGLDTSYEMLFKIDMVGVGMQVLLLAMLNVLFYLDKRSEAVGICLLFFVLNLGLSLLSIELGPQFYGYGFALAIIISAAVALFRLSRLLERHEYITFMLQR